MNDRELLKLAAKAAGWVVEYDDDEELSYTIWGDENVPMFDWNPLIDDGDALRLAVKLQIDLYNGDTIIEAERVGRNTSGHKEWIRNDPYTATRRAIVRAAAEIGRAKP